MKSVKLKIVLASAAFAGLMMSGSALAADSVTVTVNATIVGVCKFFTAAPVVNITNTGTGSNIDPSSATSAIGNAAILVSLLERHVRRRSRCPPPRP